MKKAQEGFLKLWAKGWVRAAAAGLCALLAALGTVYYWRVFYYFDEIGAAPLAALACAVALAVAGGLALIFRFAKGLALRTALLVLLCGACFCFADPPIQPPDEAGHYLRAYAISMGRLDFDGQRGYPASVDALLAAFPGAWVNGNTTYWLTRDETGAVAGGGSSANYAVKQLGGVRVSIANGFADYRGYLARQDAPKTAEPPLAQLLPYLHQAALMAAARAAGFSALGCLYAGRLANLCAYALLCYLALRGCRRCGGLLAAAALCPLSLYMAASCNYDALMIGLYLLMISFLCKGGMGRRDGWLFLAAFVAANAVKPWVNLLWLAVPLLAGRPAAPLPAQPAAAAAGAGESGPPAAPAGAPGKKSALRPWQLALLGLALALAVTAGVEGYGQAFRTGFSNQRMLGETVSMAGQLKFVLGHLPRTLMIFWGTLYENGLFLAQLGSFGALDLELPVVALLSVLSLAACAALSAPGCAGLPRRRAAGPALLGLVYLGGVLAASYITYTPVGMVRVLGVQCRYLLPCFTLFALSGAMALGWAQPPCPADGRRGQAACLGVGGAVALLSALLLAQHYFIGPVCTVPAG